MPLAHPEDASQDAAVAVARVLEELRAGEPQAQVAKRLADAGWPGMIDQPLVSKYLRGRRSLALDQAAVFERAYGKPRGWIYARAGLIDVVRLAEMLSELTGVDSTAETPGRNTNPAASIAALERAARRVLREVE